MLGARIANREPFLDFGYSRTFPDGRIQYLQVSGEPMFDASCAFAGYRGVGVDITERMEWPSALKDSRKWRASVLQHAKKMRKQS